jgi:hypothetical protein
LREYRIPLYIVDTDDEAVLREIFFRVNNSGKKMEWSEVHDALYGHRGSKPSTVAGLAAELAAMGMGRVDENELTTCLLAFRGLDPTRTLVEHRRRGEDALVGAAAEALPALKQALIFLRKRAAVPHLRLLPRLFVLEVLTRFFALHPNPSNRTQELLGRWLWRALLVEGGLDERTLVRRAVAAVQLDQEATVQELLQLVPRERQKVALDRSFDARSSSSRLAMLGLASLRPRTLDEGRLIDVAQLIEDEDVKAFRHILPSGEGPENRALHPGQGSLKRLLRERIQAHGIDDLVLASHAVSPVAAQALLADDAGRFHTERRAAATAALQDVADRVAGWLRRDHDRPSIDYHARGRGSRAR